MTSEATSEVKTPLEMFYRWEKETPDMVFLRQPNRLVWTEYTWAEVGDQVRRIASYLLSKKFPKGSRIAIWSSNSKDWPIVDFAIQLSGLVSVPIYPGQDVESANYVFNHSQSKLVFAGGFDQAARLAEALLDGMEVVGMLGCSAECTTTLEAIIDQYQPYQESPIPKGDDLLTLIYTSGTTGHPKGVMHTHHTAGHVIPDLVKAYRLDEPDGRLFSFLPMSHAAERTVVELSAVYSNTPISFSEGQGTFSDEIRSVQPTLFFAVPRLWIKFKEGIDNQISAEQQSLLSVEQKEQIATQLGLGKARIILTGSAPTPRDILTWFLDMGIILREGYSMTENFVHGVGWLKDDYPIAGSVGQVVSSNVQVRVSSTNEIQFKSKGVMKGYYLDPTKTAEVFDDGWYCSGDSGKFDDDGNLWVTGRISEVFKTTKGKFIVPARIENSFGRCDLLSQFCVFGHGKDQPQMMVTLSNVGAQLMQETLRAELSRLLKQVNAELPPFERISHLFVTPEWTIDNGLLTPTLKMKRRQIEKQFHEQVEKSAPENIISFLES